MYPPSVQERVRICCHTSRGRSYGEAQRGMHARGGRAARWMHIVGATQSFSRSPYIPHRQAGEWKATVKEVSMMAIIHQLEILQRCTGSFEACKEGEHLLAALGRRGRVPKPPTLEYCHRVRPCAYARGCMSHPDGRHLQRNIEHMRATYTM